jgi:hypothetical protein
VFERTRRANAFYLAIVVRPAAQLARWVPMIDGETANPWRQLPKSAPFLLPCDAAVVTRFNARAKCDKRCEVGLFPEPYFGRPSAPVILLALNPGVTSGDFALHSRHDFLGESRRSVLHSLGPSPFLHLQPHHLQPQAATPGSLWWQRICGALISRVGFENVAQGLFCAQFFPYHSKSFSSATPSVPSQAYTNHLVAQAMKRGAEVVVMRSFRLWSNAIPALASYDRRHRVRNPRNPALSPTNLGSSFSVVCERLAVGT